MRSFQFVLVAVFISGVISCNRDIEVRLFLDIQGKEILDRLSDLDNDSNLVSSYKTYQDLIKDKTNVVGNAIDVVGAGGVWIVMKDAKATTKECVYQKISDTAEIFRKNMNKLVDFIFQQNKVQSELAHSQLSDTQTFVTQAKEINRILNYMHLSGLKDPQQRHDQIYAILRKFDNPIFSDYSTLSFPLLLDLIPLTVEMRPHLNESDKVSCYLSSLIAEHFNIFLLDRLSKIEVVVGKDSDLQGIAHVLIANTLRTPSYGYENSTIETPYNTCNLVNTTLKTLENTNVHLVDKMATKGTIFEGDRKDCALSYFEYVRILTENIIRPLYNNISQGCTEYKPPTGKGWYIVQLGGIQLSNYMCDPRAMQKKDKLCDPYFKVRIGNKEYLHTKPVENVKGWLEIGKVFHSDRVNERTRVHVQVWDENTIVFQDKLLMSQSYALDRDQRWEGPVLTSKQYGHKLYFNILWINEYESQ